MTDSEYRGWYDEYEEREAIMLEAGVSDASRKAMIDTNRKVVGPRPPCAWGAGAGRGFVSNARFDPTAQVIPRTNRNVTRKWRKVGPE